MNLTNKQYERLAYKLLDRWIPRMRLQHWHIESRVMDVVGEDETTHAQAELFYGHTRAMIDIKAGLPFDDLRYAVIHELVHCTFQRTLMSVRQLKNDVMVKQAWEVFDQQWTLDHEHDISHMTYTLAALIPDDDLRPKDKK